MKKKVFITVFVIAILFALGIVVICMFPQLNKETAVSQFEIDYRTHLTCEFFEPETKFPTDICEYIKITQKRFSMYGYNRHFIYVKYSNSRIIHQYVLNCKKNKNVDVDEAVLNESGLERRYKGSLIQFQLYIVRGSKNSKIAITNITLPGSIQKSENTVMFISFDNLVEQVEY